MKQATFFTFDETPAGFVPSPAAALQPRPAKPFDPQAMTLAKRPHSEASMSPCKRYCYIAFRRWGTPTSDRVMFIGLYPTPLVDHERDDATLRHEVHYAHDWGYGGILKAYLYGWRTVHAAGLKAPANPIDHRRGYYDRLIATHAKRCKLIVAAWGEASGVDERAKTVLRMLDRPVHCLAKSANGSPVASRLLSKERKPELFWTPEGYADGN